MNNSTSCMQNLNSSRIDFRIGNLKKFSEIQYSTYRLKLT